ncbi:hypothetical protein ACHAXA_007444 [Cyclostephanos tholiformis]|uniref:Uncharacterized protein n=1 Tax=Cyclostephanos tholiformis TaxID=382380 RepID=A0ABD3SD23_9STRA
MDPPVYDHETINDTSRSSPLVRMPYTDNPLPPLYYSDSPPVGPPMAAFDTADPTQQRLRLDDDDGDCGPEGGDESVGIVGTTPTNRFRGIVPDRFRKLMPVVCLLLAVVFGTISYFNFSGEGDGGGVVVGGNEVGDLIINGETGEGFDHYIDNDLNDEEEEDEAVEEKEPETPLPYWTVHWCGSCSWRNFTSCDARKGYIMHRYKLSEIEAMEGLREYCAVGETSAPSSHLSKKPTESPTLSPEMLWWSRHWCGNCTWNNFTSCDSRKNYIIYRYNLKELEAMEGLREFCVVATQSPSVSSQPSSMPSQEPSTSAAPSRQPSSSPTDTQAPSSEPSAHPSVSTMPSGRPSMIPTDTRATTPKPSPSTNSSP